MSMSWMRCVDFTQTLGRPAPWCVSEAAYIAKILFLTRNVGSPHASTSCASGKARQSWRRRSTGRLGTGFRGMSGVADEGRILTPEPPGRWRHGSLGAVRSSSCERQLAAPRAPPRLQSQEVEVLMKLRSFARGATAMASVLAITACGNREVGTEAGSAELVVVVNTPIARAGAVAIHGPAASTMRVVSTDTLRGLTAGEYLARAEDASAADSLVSPVLNGLMSDSSASSTELS